MSPVAVVTGGSSGIGAAVVAELRGRGWTVTSLSRREGCDISDEAQVERAFARLDRVDALVNNAALLIKRPFAELSSDEWDLQLGAGLRGAFLCSRAAFRRMGQAGGSIVMVSSLSGVQGAENHGDFVRGKYSALDYLHVRPPKNVPGPSTVRCSVSADG